MRLVKLDQCPAGVKLGKSIYNENGAVLLAQGTYLTNSLIERLKQFHIFTIHIEDELSEGIEIVESIPEELRIEAQNVITEGLNAIIELNTNSSNFQGMMKSGRAVRSMQKVFRDLLNSLNENQTALNLLATTKVYENYVYTHSLNVSIYACQLAIENGLPIPKIEEIGLAAMLHDLGKLHIPREIINKPGKLTDEEYALIKTHCEIGFDLVKQVHEIPIPVSHGALQHHERIDGAGYPRGLKGEEIHKYARIISVADVFDVVTSTRSYRQALLPHQGIEVLFGGYETQFEGKQVQLFKECIAIYPPGLTVKLNDGRTAIVTKYNFNAVGRPEIRIIKDEENQDIQPYEINLGDPKHLILEIVEADALLNV